MKSSSRTSIKNDSFLAKHFYKSTKTNTTNSIDWAIFTLIIWSIALSIIGYYTKQVNSRLEQHTQLEELPMQKDDMALLNRQHCALSDVSLSLRVNQSPFKRQQKEVRAYKASLENSLVPTTKTVNLPHPKNIPTYYQTRTSYSAPKLQRVIVKASAEKPTLVENGNLPKNYATHTISNSAERAKLQYAVTEDVLPLQQRAAKENKLVVLSFGAKWCLPCKQMEKHTFPNENVQQLLKESYLWKKVNVKDINGYALQGYYSIKLLPTTLIIDSEGVVIGRFQGGLTAGQLTSILQEFEQPHYRGIDKIAAKKPQEIEKITAEAHSILNSVRAGLEQKNNMIY